MHAVYQYHLGTMCKMVPHYRSFFLKTCFNVLKISCVWFIKGLLLNFSARRIVRIVDILATLLGDMAAAQMCKICIGNGRQ